MINPLHSLASFGATLVVLLSTMVFSSVALASVSCDDGQLCTQTITLVPGWNAIYVQVEPQEKATEAIFADYIDGTGPQISSVWTWLAERAKIDFIQDPDPDNLLSAPGWLRYFPPQAEQAFLNNLFAIGSNRSYLVKLAGSTEVTLAITGKPVVPKANWEPGSFNLMGFHIDPANPPIFADFLASSPAHNGQPVYRLNNDSWQLVNALTTPIEPDVAYWIFSEGGSDFTGPLQVDLPQLNRLEYGTILESLTPRLQNRQSSEQQLTLGIIGGAPGMRYPSNDPIAAESWLALPASLNQTLPADGEIRLPLGVRRADFTPGNFLQTLEITSAAGSRWLIPVSAQAPSLNSLWVGTVTIDSVSQVQNYKHDCDTEAQTITESSTVNGEVVQVEKNIPAQTYALCLDAEGRPIPAEGGNVLTPVAAEFSFRVIMHREGGQVRLLKDVIQMRKPDGSYALLTDDSLIPDFTGVALRDGEVVGKRLSTMAYDFEGFSQDMTGSLDDSLSVTLGLAADAATNPFRHGYHARHQEGFAITRTLQFTFENVETGLGAGYDNKGGSYTETVVGLHKLPIISAGRFTLRHSAPINTLNQ